MKDSVIANTWLQSLLQRVAQPVSRFRGQLLFSRSARQVWTAFSLNKWNQYFKSAFCIYLGYLGIILKLVWWSESFNCDKYAKNKKKEKKISHHCIYIYIYIYIYVYVCVCVCVYIYIYIYNICYAYILNTFIYHINYMNINIYM